MANGSGSGRPAVVLRGVDKIFRASSHAPSTLKESLIGLFSEQRSAPAIQALAGVDLRVDPGESVGIVGANGSGKTTLLRIIAGITDPTHGTVQVAGRVVAMIELGAGFHPDLHGEDNVKLQGAIYNLPKHEIEGRLDAIFEFAELEDFRATALKHYSSGMIVRLGFAIAVHCRPRILLVDEVLSVGDQSFQERCLRTIREMQNDGVTIVFVTHQMEFAERVCDRMVWLKEGKVYREGKSLEVLQAFHRETIRDQYAISEGRLTPERLLVHLPGRFGTGEARIEEVRLIDSHGAARRNFRPGEPITFEISYSCESSVRELDCSITLDFEDGSNVAFWRAAAQGGIQRPTGGKGCFRLHIPSPPLLAGKYTISLVIRRPGGGDDYDLHLRLHHFAILAGEGEIPSAPVRLTPKVHWLEGGQ